MASPSPPAGCAALLKAFDESHTGVRGLVESGVSSVPDIFLHPDPYASTSVAPPGVTIPIVDLSLSFPAAAVAVAATARDWGFFHLVNYHHLHPIPLRRLPRARPRRRARPQRAPGPRARQALRPRPGRRQRLLLLQRRPLPVAVGELERHHGARERRPGAHPGGLPRRAPRLGRGGHRVGRALLGLLSKGLGLSDKTLEEASCLEGKVMVCHYYPVCPEPESTTGIVAHTDPGVLVVLTQDGVGGLQVRHHAGGEDDGRGRWVDVKPVPGALVVNLGDLLQMMSNDEYRSV
ncbi:unnamed protein product [Urochloa decumbens]|uniref:Fe2OG dioxygenase domain-containing protein n=1 Tax=Urochloa decumbens TaxID=240449 RepID=A0ABC8XER1_9POAL